MVSTYNEGLPCRDCLWPMECRYPSRHPSEARAHAEFAQSASSSSCGLQVANRSHRVSSHCSMCGKEARQQRHCSQQRDDRNDGDRIVGADSVQQPGSTPMDVDRLRHSVRRSEHACPHSGFKSSSGLRTTVGDSALELNRQVTHRQRNASAWSENGQTTLLRNSHRSDRA